MKKSDNKTAPLPYIIKDGGYSLRMFKATYTHQDNHKISGKKIKLERSRKYIIMAVFLVFLLCAGIAAAEGKYGVDLNGPAYKSAENPFYKVDPYTVECTWYCWGRAKEKLEVSLSWNGGTYLGDANDWDTLAEREGYSVGTEPRENSIMVEHYSEHGHVFFVEEIRDGIAYVSEGNYEGSYHEDEIELSTMKRGHGDGNPLNDNVTFIYLDDRIYGLDGAVDSWDGGNGNIHLVGWAFDRDSLDNKVSLHVYVGKPTSADNTTPNHIFSAGEYRSDLNDGGNYTGYYGFDETFAVPSDLYGNQPVYVYALNTSGPGFKLLKQFEVTVMPPDISPNYNDDNPDNPDESKNDGGELWIAVTSETDEYSAAVPYVRPLIEFNNGQPPYTLTVHWTESYGKYGMESKERTETLWTDQTSISPIYYATENSSDSISVFVVGVDANGMSGGYGDACYYFRRYEEYGLDYDPDSLIQVSAESPLEVYGYGCSVPIEIQIHGGQPPFDVHIQWNEKTTQADGTVITKEVYDDYFTTNEFSMRRWFAPSPKSIGLNVRVTITDANGRTGGQSINKAIVNFTYDDDHYWEIMWETYDQRIITERNENYATEIIGTWDNIHCYYDSRDKSYERYNSGYVIFNADGTVDFEIPFLYAGGNLQQYEIDPWEIRYTSNIGELRFLYEFTEYDKLILRDYTTGYNYEFIRREE